MKRRLWPVWAVILPAALLLAGCSYAGGFSFIPPVLLLVLLMPGCFIGRAIGERYEDRAVAEEIAELEGGTYCTDGENWVLYLDGDMIINGTLIPESTGDHCEYDVEPSFFCENGNLVRNPEVGDSDEAWEYNDCYYDKPGLNKTVGTGDRKTGTNYQVEPGLGKTSVQESPQVKLAGDGFGLKE